MLEAIDNVGSQRSTRTLRPMGRSTRSRRLVKAAFDYAIVAPALIFLAPLMIIIAVLIKLDSPGPVFHRRRAQGRMGREFDILSFRTVYINSNERLLQNRERWVAFLRNKRSNRDPRLTRMGVFLCRLGLDQLPCLFNILARNMSVVGPYVITKKDALYINRRRIEMIATELPGLTGMWQVQAHNISYKDRAGLELDYIRNWSLGLDMRILLATFTVLSLKKTY